MRVRSLLAIAGGAAVCLAAALSITLRAQGAGAFRGSPDDPAIAYSTGPLDNAVAEVNRRISEGTLRLTFEGRSGYLRSALEALDLPIDSQALVFSSTSLQRKSITDRNPRALFFNDRVMLGWVRDGAVIEVAAHDATQGIVFYTLQQQPAAAGAPPQFTRAFECLGCHIAGDTHGVPGLFMFSATRPSDPAMSPLSAATDQNTPLRRRFGGWFVTGATAGVEHMGNDAAALDGRPTRELTTVDGLFDTDGYRTTSSDIASLLVLSHQTQMTNLLTRAGWEARAADPARHPPFVATREQSDALATMMAGIAGEVVDYMLFIDEARLPAPVRSGSGFAARFSAIGPFDRKGRSLHRLDLAERLMAYPCSYLIYSAAFDALPAAARDPIYRRLWDVLSGNERAARYTSALTRDDRQAIVEILRDTKRGLPSYFNGAIR